MIHDFVRVAHLCTHHRYLFNHINCRLIRKHTMATEGGDQNKNGGRNELMEEMKKLGIEFTASVEHPEVFTIDTMRPHVEHLGEGALAKNLFLKDKKKKLWLLSALDSREVKLNDVAKEVGAPGGLRFADESILMDKLGVGNGCVTPLALFNDKAGDVRFICDAAFLDGSHPQMFFHPMVNSATVGITAPDLKTFVTASGHEPVVLNFDES
ncbi:prolyl-tRNA synthetase associated domain-containing protein 1-like [Amphiura filiformis]|uniref:prolyl-tRNA synthetase associated domain-containing protein 1-like n=1 Tax=Amphiura filiformis TaxID=82378 RepID=UPI003B2257A8